LWKSQGRDELELMGIDRLAGQILDLEGIKLTDPEEKPADALDRTRLQAFASMVFG